MTTVWENWRTPATEGGTITGTVEFAAPVMRDAGALTLAPIPDPVTVTGGEMSTDIPPGLYEVTIRLTYTTAGGQTRANSDGGVIVRISVPESGNHRLRELIAMGSVPKPPATWFDIASSTFLSQAVADANYAPVSGTGSPAAALTTATGRAVAFAIALG